MGRHSYEFPLCRDSECLPSSQPCTASTSFLSPQPPPPSLSDFSSNVLSSFTSAHKTCKVHTCKQKSPGVFIRSARDFRSEPGEGRSTLWEAVNEGGNLKHSSSSSVSFERLRGGEAQENLKYLIRVKQSGAWPGMMAEGAEDKAALRLTSNCWGKRYRVQMLCDYSRCHTVTVTSAKP